MKRYLLVLGAFAIVTLGWCSPSRVHADPSTLTATGILASAGTSSSCVRNSTTGTTGSCVVIKCPGGQSTADIYVPAGTLSGIVTAYTATDVAGQAGTWGTPLWTTTSAGTANTQTLSSFPGHLYVTLGSQAWVEAVLTTATSGSATAQVTCSGAVARVGNIATAGPTATPGPSLPLSVANGGTGTSSPNPTATGCGTLTGSFPSQVYDTTGCATPAPSACPSPGCVNLQATAAPTIQPGYIGVTGIESLDGIGVDGNLPPAAGLAGGVVNTTPFRFTAAGGATTQMPFIFNYATPCQSSGSSLFIYQVQASTIFTGQCGGTFQTGTTTIFGGSAAAFNCGSVDTYGCTFLLAGGATNQEQMTWNYNTACPTATGILYKWQVNGVSKLTVSCAGALLVDGNSSAPTSGIRGGVANTTPFLLTSSGGASTTEGFVFAYTGLCFTATDVAWAFTVNSGNRTTIDCQGDAAFSGKSTSAGMRNTSLASSTVKALCGASATDITQCSVNGTQIYSVDGTATPSACTALTQCGTIVISFGVTYGANPHCSAPGIQDTTTPADLWVGDIDTISTTSVTVSYSTLITLAATKTINVGIACGV